MTRMKETMTDRERIEAMLKGEKPDRVPVWPFDYSAFAVANARYDFATIYDHPDKALEAQQWCCEQYGWVFVPTFGFASYGGWEFGGEIKWPTGEYNQIPSLVRHAVATEEDAWNLKLPNVETAGFTPLLTKFSELASKVELNNKPFKLIAVNQGPFNIACNVCGLDNFLKWTIRKPDLAHHILRLTTDFLLKSIELFKNMFGTDQVLPFTVEATTSNQVISPKKFEDFAFPYEMELHQKILSLGYKHIYCHICGEQNANLPLWAKVPRGNPGIVSIGHEIDLLTAAEHFSNDIIMGNINPTTVLTGTAKEVYEASKLVIEKGKKCSVGFIFSPGCTMPPATSSINAWMLTKAANDFGWY